MTPEAAAWKRKQASLAQIITIASFILVDQLAKRALPTVESAPHVWPTFSMTVLAAGVYLLYRANDNKKLRLGISSIIAGGTSNMFDYFMHGAVLDNLRIGRLDLNAADLFIVFGAGVVLTQTLRKIFREV